MFRRPWAARAGLVAALHASFVLPAFADITVLESKGAGLKPYTALPDSVRLNVPAGASVKIMWPAGGGTKVIVGPFDQKVGDMIRDYKDKSNGESIKDAIVDEMKPAPPNKNMGLTRGIAPAP